MSMFLKKIKQLLFLFMVVPGYCIGGITKEHKVLLNSSDFSIDIIGGYAHITSTNYLCEYGGDTHKPALPYIGINILIGRNETFDSFTYSIEEQRLLDDISIVNNSRYIPTNMNYNLSPMSSNITYSGKSYPDVLIKYVGSHEADGYKYVSFLVSPFRYDNLNRTLYFENNISIVLNTNGNISKNSEAFQSRVSQDRIRELVVNGNDVSALYPLGGNASSSTLRTGVQYDYIIITNNILKPTFLKLADWNTKKGVRTKVLTTEEIYDTYLPDSTNQQKIKAALKYYYDNNTNLKYALLGRDVDVVPAQMCKLVLDNDTNHYESLCPVDLYYSNLNTMNWDGNGNGIFGELGDVCSPDPQIAITRAPVSSVSDAEAFVNRIIEYETTPKIENWSNKILMCGALIYDSISYARIQISDSHYKGKWLYKDYIKNYWDGDSVLFYDTGTDFPEGADYDFNDENIQKELSKGYTFVNVDTHGLQDCWITEALPYSVFNADTLNNSNHTIIVTSACYSNAFDSPFGCLSEAFVRNPNSGIVAYFGCSRQGWDSDDPNELGPSLSLNGELYKLMFSGNVNSFGEIVREIKENMMVHCSNDSTPYRWLLFGLNPIGDPEMPIFINTPQHFTNVTVSFVNGTLTVNTGLNDCKISVVSANDMGEDYYDVRNGMTATFNNLTDEYSICITKPGYVPYIATCGNTVYMQNEIVNRDYEIFSSQTLAGRDVTTSKPNGSVEIRAGKTTIKSENGVTLKNSFEVRKGASLEIRSGTN